MYFLKKLLKKENLKMQEAETVMQSILSQKYSYAKIAALLIALGNKGESEEEIAGFAKIMRDNSIRINPKVKNLVDSCGTGGDGLRTFNISTTVAFIAAGAGINIAKHGNRSVSSKCGSADVLEELGAELLIPEKVEKCIEKVGIGFMYAPFFHPTMKYVMPVRKELGVRTVFNLLGPLTNPANATAQLLGVYDPDLTEKFANVLDILGTKRALIVHSEGMDEIGLGKTKISELKNKKTEYYYIKGDEFGFKKQKLVKISSKKQSADILLKVLKGGRGAERDISLINAGAVIYAGGKVKSIEEGTELAKNSIDSGNALKKMDEFIGFGGVSNG